MAKADLQAAMKKRAAATQADDNFVDEVYEGVFGKTKPVQVAQKSSLPLSSLHPFKAANIGFQHIRMKTYERLPMTFKKTA